MTCIYCFRVRVVWNRFFCLAHFYEAEQMNDEAICHERRRLSRE